MSLGLENEASKYAFSREINIGLEQKFQAALRSDQNVNQQRYRRNRLYGKRKLIRDSCNQTILQFATTCA